MQMNGRITKLTGGLYTVESGSESIECRARGIFRKDGISPVVGDFVAVSDNVICEIKERRNMLLRPPVANLDQIIFVVSTTEPVPNFYVLDQLITTAESENIEPVIVFTKNDIKNNDELKQIYSNIGILSFEVDYSAPETLGGIREALKDKCSAFTGNSGVGKSTLINALDPALDIPTNEISQKLGRGKHTTRHTELYHICGGLAADTPGFSSFDIQMYKKISKDDLQYCFREFKPYIGNCRFSDCSHTCEAGCGLIEAVRSGIISKKRHESYCMMYSELKKVRPWEK